MEDTPSKLVRSIIGPADLRARPEARLPFRQAYSGDRLSLPDPCGWGNELDSILRVAASVSASETLGLTLIAYEATDPEDCRMLLCDLALQQDLTGVEILLCAPVNTDVFANCLTESGVPGRVVASPLMSQTVQTILMEAAPDLKLLGLFSGRLRLDPAALLRAQPLAQCCSQLVQVLEEIPQRQFPTLTAFATQTVLQQLWTQYDHRHVNSLNLMLPAAFFVQLGGLPLVECSELTRASERLEVAARILVCRAVRAGAYTAPLLVPELPRHQHALDHAAWTQIQDFCPELRLADGVFSIPKLSVVIGDGTGISDSVDSILAQCWADLEILIPPAKKCTEDLPLIRGGGLEQARGIYVLQLEAGDRLLPGALCQMLQVFEACPQAALCGVGLEWLNRTGEFCASTYCPQPLTHLHLLQGTVPPIFMWRRGLLARCVPHGWTDAYDLSLQLAETGALLALREPLVQRLLPDMPHTGLPNGAAARAAALERLGLARDYHVNAAGDIERRAGRSRLFIWPDFSRANPYQHLLYRQDAAQHELLVAPIETALWHLKDSLEREPDPKVSFHLHWLSPLFHGVNSREEAQFKKNAFLLALRQFTAQGGRLIWTVHNTLSHDSLFVDLERDLCTQIAELADVVHLHAGSSLPEIQAEFSLPAHKVQIARHGHYRGVYADAVSRATARGILRLGIDEPVVLFLGQVRPYKGVGHLVQSFRQLLHSTPEARLVIAGAVHDEFWDTVHPELSDTERERIVIWDRFLDEAELQLFLRAADVAVFPYRNILTSGSLMLALSFDLPVVIPAVGMTREVVECTSVGRLYAPSKQEGEASGLGLVLSEMLAQCSTGHRAHISLTEMQWCSLDNLFIHAS